MAKDNDFDALIDNFFETDQTLEEIFFAVTDPLPVLDLAAEAFPSKTAWISTSEPKISFKGALLGFKQREVR